MVCTAGPSSVALAVGIISRPGRTNNGSPISFRSRASAWLTAGWDRNTRCAARVTLRSAIMASNTRRRFRSKFDIFIRCILTMMRMHFHYARSGGMLLAMVIATLDRNTRKVTRERAHGQRPPLSPEFKAGRFSAKRGAIDLRDVVVYVDGRAENTGTLEFAAALSFEHEAHLIGVFIQPELALSRAEMFVRGKGIEDVVAAHQGKLSGIETDRRALFESVARRHGIRAEWRLVPSADSSESAVHARYGDLAIVARQDTGDRQVGLPRLVEVLVLTSGPPTIVLPPPFTAPPIPRLLVGWNRRRE